MLNQASVWEDKHDVLFLFSFLLTILNLFLQVLVFFFFTDASVFYGVIGIVMQDMNRMLCRPFTREKIQQIFFQMHPQKASRCDGLPTLCFQIFWHNVDPQVIYACLDFLNLNGDMGSLNR